MIVLQSDNRILTANAKYTYLTQNYSSGVSTLNVSNTEPLSVDKFVLLGEFGHTNAEIFRIVSLDSTTGDIVIGDADGVTSNTIQAHPESTKVTFLPYNKVKFFWTAVTGTISDEDPTFDSDNPLSSWTGLDPSSYYTSYTDSSNLTGFGWFKYRNSVTTEVSQESNPIPYAGFSLNTVSNVFADFESLLNVRELKLVKLSDKFAWLNEALAILKNKLNLTNVEYTVSTPQELTIVADTNEYLLPDDFCDMVEITTGLNSPTTLGRNIPFMPVSKALAHRGGTHFSGTIFYYLRGRYLGFVPTPETSATYYYTYRKKATRLTSLSDYIDVPDNAFYALKDFMMYRAKLKFSDPSAAIYYQAFADGVSLFMQSAVKRSANLDTWSISPEANV